MLSIIFNQLKWLVSDREKEKDIKARKHFEKNLEKLFEDSDEEEKGDEQEKAQLHDPVLELTWNCMKLEGVVSSLNETNGMINDKHNFHKSKALDVWGDLKVGSKVSFFLFKDTVESLKVLDAAWDANYEDNLKNLEDIITDGYSTESRTVLGIVEEVNDGIISVDVGNEKHYIPAPEGEDAILYTKGDNIKMDCVTTEDDTKWNPSIGTFGNIVSFKGFEPNSKKQEVGRVTSTFDDHAVFDESIILNFNCVKNPQKVALWDKFHFEAIETSISYDGRNFNWRVIELIKKIETKEDSQIEEMMQLQMDDEQFQLRQSTREFVKFIQIFNKSNRTVTLLDLQLTSNSGFIQLQNNKTFELRPFYGSFKIYFTLTPAQYGTFVEELIADFGAFKKRCLITLQVLKSNNGGAKHGRNSRAYNSNRDIIPGQKITASIRFIDIRITDYFVCDKFRKTFDFKKHMLLLIEDFEAKNYSFLTENLKEQNYLAKMRHCLYLEEIAMEIYFDRYKIDRAHFDNHKDGYLRLEIEGVNEKRPSIGMGDSIHVRDPYMSKERQQIYEGIIHKVENNAILVKFHSDFHSNHNRRDYSIEFFFSRSPFKRQHYALDQVISPRGLGMDFLFPNVENFKKNLQVEAILSEDGKIEINGKKNEFFNQSLNDYQKNAVINVLQGECRPLPYIIYGPPGTGKTHTVIECIEQISSKLPWARIIVATPSNSAANLIVDKLVESGRYKGGDFVRFVSYNQIERDSIPPHLKKYCATIDIGYDKGDAANLSVNDNGIMMNCSKSIIIKYKIYISTLSNLGPLMHIKFMRDHFTHVIIDEAGQSVETETVIPFTFLSRTKGQVILAGDPKQLGPVLISNTAKHCGFDKSLLERLSEHKYYLPFYGLNNDEYDSRFVTKLKKNYRSLPSILHVYSHLFYNNQLEAEVKEEYSKEMKLLSLLDTCLWNRQFADEKCGVFFVNVNGRNLRTPESSSWFNDEEASRVFLFACRLKRQGISMENVGVITPYTLQVKRLRGIFDEAMPDCGLKIGSVEEFQGQERDIILVSTVRTNHKLVATDQTFGLGFLQSSKRMNVAISRARALLVVFGKESLLAQDNNWRYLIQYARQKGTYVCDQ